MADMCGDNRFELIEKYKRELIECTNIETSPDEMAVLDILLFRFWQMGWLDKIDKYVETIRCKDCNWFREGNGECVLWNYEKTNKNAFCFYGSRKQTGTDYAGFEVYEAERPE